MSKVLIVEDEVHLAEGLRFNLEAEGYDVSSEETGEAALERLANDPGFELVLLDIMLPGKSGFEVATELRRAGNFIPVLMLTARGRPEDVLMGFEAGADDYLAKPFELSILIARIGGLLRRHRWMRQTIPNPEPDPAPSNNHLVFAGKSIDFNSLQLSVGGRQLQLTLMEANFLRYLIQHEGQTVSRKAMLEEVWEVREDTDTRAIDNFVVRLRRYIEDDPTRPKHLLTVRGVGYRFIAEPVKS